MMTLDEFFERDLLERYARRGLTARITKNGRKRFVLYSVPLDPRSLMRPHLIAPARDVRREAEEYEPDGDVPEAG